MLIYCPDWNGHEKRKKKSFYKVQNSDIEVLRVPDCKIPGKHHLVVWHGRDMADAYHSEGDAEQPKWWEGYIWWELCGLYYWKIGNKGDAYRVPKY